MARTAYQEHYGESQSATISSDYRLRSTSGPGGCRLYAITAMAPGLKVLLPDARRLRAMGDACYTIANRGANTFTVRDADDALVTTVTSGNACDLWLLSNTTAAGQWIVDDYVMGGNSPILMDRQVIQFVYGNENRTNVVLLDEALAMGFDITRPSALQVHVVDDGILGSADTGLPALSTGYWPSGTTLRLFVGTGARICGKGGAGGRGGNAGGSSLAVNGGDGGPAVTLAVDTVLLNYGKIQGGGGGGGGGAGSTGPIGSIPGGGGGGGAGHRASLGGASGLLANGNRFAAGDGRPGTIDSPGLGGSSLLFVYAGSGGAAGSAGQSGAAIGGGAGPSFQKVSGITLTKIEPGTIDGPEVTI